MKAQKVRLYLVEETGFESRVERIAITLFNSDESSEAVVELLLGDGDFLNIASERQYSDDRKTFIAKLLVKKVHSNRQKLSFEEALAIIMKVYRMYAPPLQKKL